MEAVIFNIQKFSLHDGPGIRTAVFFKGCNLRCKWCANPESFSGRGRHYTLDEVLSEVLKDKPFYASSGGGVTLTGGEPLLQPEFVCALCDALHAEGVNIAVETAADVPADVFERVLERCDFALIDVKHWDSEAHFRGTGSDNRRILGNLRRALARQMPVAVRIPVIPGFNDSSADARGFAELLSGFGARDVHHDARVQRVQAPRLQSNLCARDVHLLPFHQLGESKYAELGIPYAYAGAAQLHEDGLAEFAGIITAASLRVQIGG